MGDHEGPWPRSVGALVYLEMATGNSPSGFVSPSPSPWGKIFPIPVPAKAHGGRSLPIPEPDRGMHPRRGPRPRKKLEKEILKSTLQMKKCSLRTHLAA